MVHLSDGEWKIMQLLWQQAPRTIMQLTADLQQETDWTKHTAITMLNRMEKKGAVRYEEGARAKLYYPLVEREEAAASETRGFLNKVYEGSLSLMVNSMVSQKHVSQKELEELYAILQQAEEETWK